MGGMLGLLPRGALGGVWDLVARGESWAVGRFFQMAGPPYMRSMVLGPRCSLAVGAILWMWKTVRD